MAWHQPEDHHDHDDPWSRSKKEQGPPDLDEMLTRFLKGWGRTGSSPQGPAARLPWLMLFLIALVAYGLLGLYIVYPMQTAIVTRFGAYQRSEGPGMHWFARGIESVEKVNTEEIFTITRQDHMLTQDENIVHVEVVVQYRIQNAQDYLFRAALPVHSLEQITDSALRDVIGHSTLDAALTQGRAHIVLQMKRSIEALVDRYKLGLLISDVALQSVKPPTQVQAAFDDAIRAQTDEVSFKNKAEAYANQVIPEAMGRAARWLAQAEADKDQALLAAQGDIASFQRVLPEYRKNKTLMKDRMYLKAWEKVWLSPAEKILLDGHSQPWIGLPQRTSESVGAATVTHDRGQGERR